MIEFIEKTVEEFLIAVVIWFAFIVGAASHVLLNPIVHAKTGTPDIEVEVAAPLKPPSFPLVLDSPDEYEEPETKADRNYPLRI